MSGSSNSSSTWKLLQKRIYDILQQRYTLLLIFAGFVVIVVSAFHFGEIWLEWSREKYEAVFNSYSDNIARRSYQKQLCQYVPIDVVYTWVNGSDPHLMEQLKLVKESLQDSQSEVVSECNYRHCVPAHILAVKSWLPESTRLADVQGHFPNLQAVGELKRVVLRNGSSYQNKTFLIFQSAVEAKTAAGKQPYILTGGQNYSLYQTYWTSEWHAPNTFPMDETVILLGVHAGLHGSTIHQKLPKEIQAEVEHLWLYPEKSQAIITLSTKKAADDFLKLNQNFTLDGKDTQLDRAYLIIGLSKSTVAADFSSNRYEDKEELRYSMRSIEKFAPWVRHIYLVTNGQIPHWLNLDNPRLTIITHEEIFPNKQHLPTFGSPAIESHLHRIPGLSDKFLYLNDDVMFGKNIWPEDFYTHARGQKVYLSWPVPECQEGCPNSWISDGYCDKACNNTDCMWDGGDCKDGKQWSGGQHAGADSALDMWQMEMEKGVCASNCVNSWLADKYCDTNCNNLECGFDAGDCGIRQYHQLLEMNFSPNQTNYSLPQGVTAAYWNLTELMTRMELTGGEFEDSAVVRVMAVGIKFKVLTLVLYPEHRTTNIQMCIKGKVDGNEREINFNVTVNTVGHKEESSSLSVSSNDVQQTATASHVTEPPVVFETFQPWELQPVLLEEQKVTDDMSLDKYYALNISALGFPRNITRKDHSLFQLYMNGELTRKGYLVQKRTLIKDYIAKLKQQGRQPSSTVYETASSRNKTKNINNIFVKRDSDSVNRLARMNVQLDDGALIHMLSPSKKLKNKRLLNIAWKQKGQSYVDKKNLMQHTPEKVVGPNNKTVNKILKENVKRVNSAENDKVADNLHRTGFRKIQGIPVEIELVEELQLNNYLGFLPWEKQQSLQKDESKTKTELYVSDGHHSRNLLDTFADSLLHVNRIFNKKFGFEARKVPAHMPHLIDKYIMTDLQERFPEEWEETSSHRVRSSTDMQFSFSYFYFLMSERMPFNAGHKFDEFDTDASGTLSDREIRTLLTQLYDPPLTYNLVHNFEEVIINCSHSLPLELSQGIPTPQFERYSDSKLPTVSRQLLLQCPPVVTMLQQKYHNQKKYKFETVGEEEVAFKMLTSNLSHVVGMLDNIRRHPKKFICINDNMDPRREKDNVVVQAILQDFYESLFPIPSSFELPPEYRNRFLYMSELQHWRMYRDIIKVVTYLCLIILIVFSLTSFFQNEITAIQRRFCRHKRKKTSCIQSTEQAKKQLLKKV